MNWFPLFLQLGALGIVSMLRTVPMQELGPYFFRLLVQVALFCAALAVLIAGKRHDSGVSSPPMLSGWLFLVFAILLLVMTVLFRKGASRFPREVWGLTVCAGIAVVIVGSGPPQEWPGLEGHGMISLHRLSAAFLLGSSVVAMILGHWYLSKAALSFDHLVRATKLILAAVGVRLLVAGAGFAVHCSRGEPFRSEWDGMMAGVRILAGLLGTGVLAWMALSCAKRKANQSATGILYVVVFFVLVGELISLHLTVERGVPI